MRDLIDVVSQIGLRENTEEVRAAGRLVTVLRNPSRAQLRAAAARTDLRGLVDKTGDTFWWPASEAIHASVARALGLDGNIYANDGVSRLEAHGLTTTIVSGLETARHSKSLRYLTTDSEMQIQGLSFDDWIARYDRYRAWYDDGKEKRNRGQWVAPFTG